MDSLCNLRARLRLALPNLYDLQETLQSRQTYPSPDMEKLPIITSPSEHDSSILTQMDSRQSYPVLVEHMVTKLIVARNFFLFLFNLNVALFVN